MNFYRIKTFSEVEPPKFYDIMCMLGSILLYEGYIYLCSDLNIDAIKTCFLKTLGEGFLFEILQLNSSMDGIVPISVKSWINKNFAVNSAKNKLTKFEEENQKLLKHAFDVLEEANEIVRKGGYNGSKKGKRKHRKNNNRKGYKFVE